MIPWYFKSKKKFQRYFARKIRLTDAGKSRREILDTVYLKFRRSFTEREYQMTLTNPYAFMKWILCVPWKVSRIQLDIMNAYTKYPEVLVICGSKGGKSTLSAILTLWRIYILLQEFDPCQKYGLNPNTNIYSMNIAPKDDMARNIVLNYIKGYAENSWYMNEFVEHQRKNEIEFTDHIIARAQGSSAKAGRGYQIYSLTFDEFCHFLDTVGNLSGSECVNAFMPRLLPFKTDGRFLGISTPAGRSGAAYDMFTTGKPYLNSKTKKPYIIQTMPTQGEQDFRAVFQAPTWVLNPLYPENHPFLRKEKIRDLWSYDREYGALFADVVQPFLSPEQIKAVLYEIPIPSKDFNNYYVMALDPSLKYDAFGLGLGYLNQNNQVVIPIIKRYEPKKQGENIDFLEVEKDVNDFYKRFNIYDIIGDERLITSMIQRMVNQGKPARGVLFGANTDMIIYGNLFERIIMRKIKIQKQKDVESELKYLQRIVFADRYRVQAAVGSHDDLTDVVAMITWALTVGKGNQGGVVIG